MPNNITEAQAVPDKKQQKYAILPQQEQVPQPQTLGKHFPFPEEPDFVGKYGDGTFGCCDDIESCLFSFCCLPCANGYACAWAEAIHSDESVIGCVCFNLIFTGVSGGLCHCFMAAEAHKRVEKRIATFNNHSALDADKLCCHFLCTGCEQAKLQRAIKNFKKIHGYEITGQPGEINMKR
jgi:hypothetical protein